MINLEYYDKDFVNPLPHVFDRIAVMTPPKNASSYINLHFGREQGRLTVVEAEYDKIIAIKRDPIDRWCGAVNQQKGRMRWNCWGDNSKDIEFWDRDPNDIVNDHIKEDSPIRHISEFCSQYDWAGSMTEYDESFYLHDVDKLVIPMLGVIPTEASIPYRNESRTKNIVSITKKDLTNETKDKIMNIYENDYKYGWC